MDVNLFKKGFRNFFERAIDYPIMMTNQGFNWFCFEVSYEEFGVIVSNSNETFNTFLQNEFIDMKLLKNIGLNDPVYQSIANVLIKNFGMS